MMVLTPVWRDNVTIFNYDVKKSRSVVFTCWCHLNIIVLVSIFQESMKRGITCFLVFFLIFFVVCFFFGGWHCYFSGWKRWSSFYHLTSVGLINLQMRLINIQWDLRLDMSGNFRLRTLLWGSFVFEFYVVINQQCCAFVLYNCLTAWDLLQINYNTIMNLCVIVFKEKRLFLIQSRRDLFVQAVFIFKLEIQFVCDKI